MHQTGWVERKIGWSGRGWGIDGNLRKALCADKNNPATLVGLPHLVRFLRYFKHIASGTGHHINGSQVGDPHKVYDPYTT
ncbi:MAG: hypothetical protein R2788_17955 [Saprospiraceae bacterium]